MSVSLEKPALPPAQLPRSAEELQTSNPDMYQIDYVSTNALPGRVGLETAYDMANTEDKVRDAINDDWLNVSDERVDDPVKAEYMAHTEDAWRTKVRTIGANVARTMVRFEDHKSQAYAGHAQELHDDLRGTQVAGARAVEETGRRYDVMKEAEKVLNQPLMPEPVKPLQEPKFKVKMDKSPAAPGMTEKEIGDARNQLFNSGGKVPTPMQVRRRVMANREDASKQAEREAARKPKSDAYSWSDPNKTW